MTKAACTLILRIGSVSLSWRTFKTLKRLGKDCNDNDIDWEILQLWSLYAFQIMFSRMEWVASFIPFYYYFKMILLLVTFLPGTRFPNYWFEIILIPLMHHVHTILDSDWKGFLKKEVILLPYQLIDLFLLPGFFTTEEEMNAIKNLRKQQLKEASQLDLKLDSNSIRDSSGVTIEKNVSASKPISPDRKGIDLGPNSGASWSRVAASSQQLRKLSLEYRRHSLPNIANSPTRRKMRPTPENDPRFSPVTNTPPTSFNLKRDAMELNRYDSPTSLSNNYEISSKDTATSITSKRVTTHLTERTKLMNETFSTPIRKRSPVRVYSPRTQDDAAERLSNLVQDSYDDDVSIRSGRSSSLGDGVRRFITGNPNIRIRDYLFDLDLPSIPPKENVSPKQRARISHNLDSNDLRENRRKGWSIENKIITTGVHSPDSNQKHKPRRSRRLAAIKTSK